MKTVPAPWPCVPNAAGVPAVAVDDLHFSYGNEKILRGVSLSAPAGVFFILIGPNGSGKTTLMKRLAGLGPHRSGKSGGSDPSGVRILGRPLADWPRRELARKLAFVPQHPVRDIPFTAAETVLMGRSPHQGVLGMASDRDRELTEWSMKRTATAHLARRRIDRLSGGELQRVFIARALCQEPEILLLDEPTSFLDMAHQIQIMDILEGLKREKGMTVMMISHDINLAAMYGDRLLLLADGRAAAAGTPREVVTQERMEAAYGCRVQVETSPLGDFPRILPVPGRFSSV